MFVEDVVGFHETLLAEALFEDLTALFEVVGVLDEVPGVLLHGVHLGELRFFCQLFEVFFVVVIEVLRLLVQFYLFAWISFQPFDNFLRPVEMVHHLLEIYLLAFLILMRVLLYGFVVRVIALVLILMAILGFFDIYFQGCALKGLLCGG